MAGSTNTTRFRFWLSPVRFIGLIVPQRLRADWRQEWEAELRYHEVSSVEWESWKGKFFHSEAWFDCPLPSKMPSYELD